ncbi:hypothetical protein B481_3141 [Planococcus halocryophilus Or1]|uniref:Uncharacterized protein n=1 Tax=Planococcus halocryophilus TaxID=1215089 RepID=A0A1C7DNK7_9BACL|nr:hypothetical protein [Planococcus halocryophilus]ANU12803.1 hypothetical protein BBI08_02645 [Planococcus halocryophilus]EMF45291.1 hypothetical protein B481_3141 [Planococcus halocryophilus Or1]
MKNQQGYALLIVLLMVVLFMGISATFIAGSLSNAAQEQTVDTSNQSVASAEMGAKYFSTDFERELELIKMEIFSNTQERVNLLISCIQVKTDRSCDNETKIAAIETKIDKDMRTLYMQKILTKVTELDAMSGIEIIPFLEDQIKYAVAYTTANKLDSAGDIITDPAMPEETVKAIKVEMEMTGTSKEISSGLKAFFTIEVPDTFLNASEPLIIETEISVEKEGVTYQDVFSETMPAISCADLVTQLKVAGNNITPPYECNLGQSLKGLLKSIETANLDPELFKVYTSNFTTNICTDNCNSLDFKGVTIVVNPEDTDAFNNMNNLIKANLQVNGELTVGNNLINLGKNGNKQTIILEELNVGNNIQNMYYTNFLILGRRVAAGMPENVSRIRWGQNFEVDNYSNLCIDIDKILPADLERLSEKIKFTNSGKMIYFTKYSGKNFELTGKINGKSGEERTGLYVKRMDDYTTFLNACGVTLKDTVTESTEVAVPNVLDPEFDFEVEY